MKPPVLDSPSQPPKKSGIPFSSGYFMLIIGIGAMSLGLTIYLWAQYHAPDKGFWELLKMVARDPHDFIFKPWAFSVLMGFVGGVELFGILMLVLGFVRLAKKKE